jgi:predicted transcriptional regulator
VQAYIYLSSPRKAIAGLVEFGSPIIDTPSGIAEFAEQQHTGSFAGMLEYLEGKERGFAIPILSYERISPIPLAVLREQFSFTAPQNYMVLDNYPELLTFIRDHSRI